MRKPELSVADTLRVAYEAKALAELADADAVTGAGPGTWDGPVVGAHIAFLTAHPDTAGSILGARTTEAVAKAAGAMGAADAVFVLVTRPTADYAPEAAARRVRMALEAVDAPAVIALDSEGAEDLARAFGLDGLPTGADLRVFGRSLGSVGDFAASLDDAAAKSRAWSTMKKVAAGAGIKAKTREP